MPETKPTEPEREAARQWLNKTAPVDDRPPFGDEKLRNDPAYETIDILTRDDAIELLSAYASTVSGPLRQSAEKMALQNSRLVELEIKLRNENEALSEQVRSLEKTKWELGLAVAKAGAENKALRELLKKAYKLSIAELQALLDSELKKDG